MLLAGCRSADTPATTQPAPALSFNPPAGWSTETTPGLTWSAVPPSADPLAGHVRLSLSETELADSTPPSGKLQVTSLVEDRNLSLPGGAFQTTRHRTARYGSLEGLETESTLVGAGGSRLVRQFSCWVGNRQYSLTLVADETGYEPAATVFGAVVAAASGLEQP